MIYEIIIDGSETPNKCTIAPLRSRPDFRLSWVRGGAVLGPLQSPILLHHEGRCITEFATPDLEFPGIASVDCVWHRLSPILRRIQGPLPPLARIPEGFQTAYPRRSSVDRDPEGGLATIEAIFTASALLGRWDVSLLSEYYFGRKFVELNSRRFLELGVTQAADERFLPILNFRQRHALQRRLDRGKFRRLEG